MNCKPGDIARVIKPGYLGMLVHVIQAAPAGVEFQLPCGYTQLPVPAGYWVIEVLGERIPCKLRSGKYRNAKFGSCSDSVLRPLRDPGDDAVDEVLQKLGKPDDVRCPALIGNGGEA